MASTIFRYCLRTCLIAPVLWALSAPVWAASCTSLFSGGVVNTYHPGSTASVASGATSIALGAATGASTPIAAGDLLLIVQMQDASIDATNSNAYGDGVVSAAASGTTGLGGSGLYEYALAANAVSLTGGTLTLSAGTINPYVNAAAAATRGQRRYQVIRVPVYADAAINPANPPLASAWNGMTGGVLAFDVTGALALGSATVDLSGQGFRGGGGRQLGGGTGAPTDYRTLATVDTNGAKGEGVAGTSRYLLTAPSTLTNTGVEGYPNGSNARGAPANAGGGGTDGDPAGNGENTGGGGGGNAGGGGQGGIGWCGGFNAAAPPDYGCANAGGFGGAAIAGLGAARLTMGGGGGAGTTNNGTGALGGLSSSGAAGGGIIMVRAGSLTGSGTFNANGGNADNTVRNDGSGGGGAGGVVMISAGSGLAGVTVNVNGGNGGSNLVPPGSTAAPHGPGGGGGGGLVIASAAVTWSAAGGASGVTYNNGVLFGPYGASPGEAGSALFGLAGSQMPGTPLGSGSTCSNLASFLVNAPTYGSTCGMSAGPPASPIIDVTAKDGPNGTGSIATNYTGSVTLTTSTGTGTFAIATGAGTLVGNVYTFAAADKGAASFYLNNTIDGQILTVTAAAGAASGTSSSIQFERDFYTVTSIDALGNTVVAGRPHAMRIQRWRACSLQNINRNINFRSWYDADPDHPNGAAAPRINGGGALPSADPGTANLSLRFNSGTANFTLNTSDIGKYGLNFLEGGRRGSSSLLTARPFALVVSGIRQGAINNPGGTATAGSGFIAAADVFQATVGAYQWNSAADGNNDGVPDAGATFAQITATGATASYSWPTRLAAATPFTPAAGTLGAFGNALQKGICATGAPNCFTGGIATPTNLSYAEAGSFTMTGTATDILNTGGLDLAALVFDNSAAPARNGVVGRFFPDHFALLAGSAISSACGGGAGFTYMGQPALSYSFSIEARNKSNATTINYINSPAYNTGTVAMLAEDSNDGIDLSARLAAPAGSWLAGSYAFATSSATFSRLAMADGPFDALQIGVRVTDADGPVLAARDMDPTTNIICTAGTCTGAAIGGATTRLRYGKLKIANGYGSELLPLPVSVAAQYWDGAAYITNLDDNCTSLAAAGFDQTPGPGAAINTTIQGGGTTAGGAGRIRLAKPTSFLAKGSVFIRPGAALSVWLPGDAGLETFGIYKRGPIIYFREMY